MAIVDCLLDCAGGVSWAEGGDAEKAHWDELLTFLFVLLAHPFAKLRKYVAEQLYITCLDNDAVVKDPAKYDDACSHCQVTGSAAMWALCETILLQ